MTGSEPTVAERLAPWSRPGTLLLLVAATALALALFNLQPELDLAAARLFFRENPCLPPKLAGGVCGWFDAREDASLEALRQALQALPAVLAVCIAVYILLAAWRAGWRATGEVLAGGAVLASYPIAAGLLVNGLLKAYSGRPRPIDTDLFGGNLPFVPAGQFTNYCASNCSFVSGEASGAFWLVGISLLLPKTLRLPALALALALAVLTSAMRIAFGAHYLSDVLLAGLLTLTTLSLCAIVAAWWAGKTVREARI